MTDTKTNEAAERLSFDEPRHRRLILKRELAKGLEIIALEHPEADLEWRAGWLSGYVSEVLLHTESAERQAGRQEAVRPLTRHPLYASLPTELRDYVDAILWEPTDD